MHPEPGPTIDFAAERALARRLPPAQRQRRLQQLARAQHAAYHESQRQKAKPPGSASLSSRSAPVRRGSSARARPLTPATQLLARLAAIGRDRGR